MNFTWQGKAPKGGTVTLRVDGHEVVNGKIDEVPPVPYSAAKIFNIGIDPGSVVAPFLLRQCTTSHLKGKLEK